MTLTPEINFLHSGPGRCRRDWLVCQRFSGLLSAYSTHSLVSNYPGQIGERLLFKDRRDSLLEFQFRM